MRPVRLAVVLDCCCVLAFVIIGRASHARGESLPGIASTAWPFLAGLAFGWLAARAWRRPLGLVPAGVGAWLGAVVLGMVLRVVAGQGTAVAFIFVALAFLGLFLLGWRLVARLATRGPTALGAERDGRGADVVAFGDAGDVGKLVAGQHLQGQLVTMPQRPVVRRPVVRRPVVPRRPDRSDRGRLPPLLDEAP